jgi:cellulose synthase/poly-beta-1,6-N-acetylglucosamine synthase-like glycosyltransferase
MITEIVRNLFYLLTGVPLTALLLYAVAILYYGRKNENNANGANDNGANDNGANVEYEPLVSVVVPTHNEELIILKKIENLRSSTYPLNKTEIIFVDDSTDSTPDLISKIASKLASIRLLRFKQRIGYSPSMLAGCKAAKGEIIILNDAASFLDSQAISNIVRRFRDPRIGVVTGRDVILNVNEEVGKSESFYQKLYNFLRVSETNMDSTFYIKGEASGVRANVLEDLNVAAETFDTTVGLVARQKGFKVIYDPEVSFYEYAPRNHSGRIGQKTIRAANLMKVLWRYKFMMFRRKYGKYGSLILPFNFALLTVVPTLVLAWFISLVFLTFLNASMTVLVWTAIGIAFLLMFTICRQLLFTFLEFEYSLLRAIYQTALIRKTHDKIDKVVSTRRLQ